MQNMKNMQKIQITIRKPSMNTIQKLKVKSTPKLNSIPKPSLKKLKWIQKPRNMKKMSASLENLPKNRKNPENTISLKNQRNPKNMKSPKNRTKSRKKNPKTKSQRRSRKTRNFRRFADFQQPYLQIRL